MSGRFSDTKNLHIMLRVVSDKHSRRRAKQEEETMEVKAEKRSKITS